MAAIGQHLSPLLLSKRVVRPTRLGDAVGYTMNSLDIGAPQVDVDLVVLCGDDAGTSASAVGPLDMPPVLSLVSHPEHSLTYDLCGLWRPAADHYDLNGRVVVIRCD